MMKTVRDFWNIWAEKKKNAGFFTLYRKWAPVVLDIMKGASDPRFLVLLGPVFRGSIIPYLALCLI